MFLRNTKSPSGGCRWGLLFLEPSGLALYDLAGLDAAGADADALACAVDNGLDCLQVHVPATARGVVGVRDVVTELRSLAAKFTNLCHDEELQS